MRKLITIGLLAVALAMGNNALADKPLQVPQNKLVILGVDRTGAEPFLVMAYRALPNSGYVLQGTRDFRVWEDIELFRPHDAAHPTILEVPISENYMFFRVMRAGRGTVRK